MAVSILILIVGSGFHQDSGATKFSISQLSDFIGDYLGTAGEAVFSLGFIAAALSSILTCPLAAALTADSVLSWPGEEGGEGEEGGQHQGEDDQQWGDPTLLSDWDHGGVQAVQLQISSV